MRGYMRKTLFAAVGWVFVVGSANTAASRPANIAGFGTATCRDITALFIADQPRSAEVLQWAIGYMSGLNTASIAGSKVYRDFSGLIGEGRAGGVIWPLLDACKNRPDALFVETVHRYYEAIPVRPWTQ